MSIFDQTMESGSSLIHMVPAHLSVPLITGQEIGTKTCGVGNVLQPDDLWFSSDICKNCAYV